MIRATRAFGSAGTNDTCDGGGLPHNRDMDYSVVKDPSGDYRVGATFSLTELRHMLKVGSVESGTILRHRGGALYKVIGRTLADLADVLEKGSDA